MDMCYPIRNYYGITVALPRKTSAYYFHAKCWFCRRKAPAKSAQFPIFASGAGIARATRKNGESTLILRALCARKMSALNEKCTSGMLPAPLAKMGCSHSSDTLGRIGK
jgi:hypothetical protein